MGAWNHKNFGNDDAMDFVPDVIESGFNKVIEAINTVVSSSTEDYLEAPEECMALAAIEVIAAVRNNPSDDFPDELNEWIKNNSKINIDDNIIMQSNKAIKRILDKNSELNELWQDTQDYQNWQNCIKDLEQRIL